MKAKQRFLEMVRQFSAVQDASEAEAIALMLLEYFAKINRTALIRQPDVMLSEKTMDDLLLAERRILQHEPVQYVTGEAYFHGRIYKVSKDVLIPRPETEELVSWLLEACKGKQHSRVLDIGTGSGCIAISIQHALPAAEVTAIDLSGEALTLAQLNAGDMQETIDWMEMDFLQAKNWTALGEYDIIVSNPPYIPKSYADQMEKHVVEHEPSMALFVPDEDPLIFYRKISEFGQKKLTKNGLIFLELHADHAKETMHMFSAAGYSTLLKHDIYGKPRMLKASLLR